jgi:hypothetical protein
MHIDYIESYASANFHPKICFGTKFHRCIRYNMRNTHNLFHIF